MAQSEYNLDVSWETIIRIAVILFILYLLYLTRVILVWTIFGIVISVILNPAVDFLESHHVPRVAGTIIVYALLLVLIAFSVYLIVPLFISEINQFTHLFPKYFSKLSPLLQTLGFESFKSIDSFTQSLNNWLVNASSNIFTAVGSIFGGFLSSISIFSIALFLSLEEKWEEKMISLFSPSKYTNYVLDIWHKSERRVAGWLGIRIVCSIFVGTLTVLACYILGTNYPVSFGLLAGLLDIIPMIGPLIAATIIAILIALSSWSKMFLFILIFFIIQQLESNVLIPVLAKKFMNLPPALIIVALLIGGRLFGALGAILSIPLLGMLYEFVIGFAKIKKEKEGAVL